MHQVLVKKVDLVAIFSGDMDIVSLVFNISIERGKRLSICILSTTTSYINTAFWNSDCLIYMDDMVTSEKYSISDGRPPTPKPEALDHHSVRT